MTDPFVKELESLHRYRTRAGRCHELATTLMLRTDRTDLLFVQGRIYPDRLHAEHSWIEHAPTGLILDPVEAKVYEPDRYHGRAIKKYTKKDMALQMVAEGFFCYFRATMKVDPKSGLYEA
jgi:hypothetical protein